jgi:predicted short-subunit dehydrogenase-like oxidoreductase (DUF2520 family)
VRRARLRLPESEILPVDVVAGRSELLLLAVPDAELASLVHGLADTGVVRAGTIVAHTSGANGVSVLAPLVAVGALPLAIHPVMTFTGHDDDLERLAGACFGVTAIDEIGYAIAQSLVIEIGGEPVRVPEAHRALYHAALAHGSNHLVTLAVDAAAALRAVIAGNEMFGQDAVSDEPNGLAERMLRPLMFAALDNALRRGPAALTGPVARGDVAAVAAHLAALEIAASEATGSVALDPQVAAGYRAMSLRTAQLAKADQALLNMLSPAKASEHRGAGHGDDPRRSAHPDRRSGASPEQAIDKEEQ